MHISINLNSFQQQDQTRQEQQTWRTAVRWFRTHNATVRHSGRAACQKDLLFSTTSPKRVLRACFLEKRTATAECGRSEHCVVVANL